jgi:hypothetical protein
MNLLHTTFISFYMNSIRFNALNEALGRIQPVPSEILPEKVSDFFGINTFSSEVMQKYLSEGIFKNIKSCC